MVGSHVGMRRKIDVGQSAAYSLAGQSIGTVY